MRHHNRLLQTLAKGPHIRWIVILVTTGLGAIWLWIKGPTPVVRGATAIEEMAPSWYMISAFPILGVLLADLVSLWAQGGWGRPVFELALQIALQVLASNLRLVVQIPLSGHATLFGYVALRRLLVRFPHHRLAWLEGLLALLLYALVAYVKLTWWSDPLTLAVGSGVAVVLAGVSFFVSRDILTLPSQKAGQR